MTAPYGELMAHFRDFLQLSLKINMLIRKRYYSSQIFFVLVMLEGNLVPRIIFSLFRVREMTGIRGPENEVNLGFHVLRYRKIPR